MQGGAGRRSKCTQELLRRLRSDGLRPSPAPWCSDGFVLEEDRPPTLSVPSRKHVSSPGCGAEPFPRCSLWRRLSAGRDQPGTGECATLRDSEMLLQELASMLPVEAGRLVFNKVDPVLRTAF